jgi:membrane protein required for colicin V production
MTLDLVVCGLILFFALLGALAGGFLQMANVGGLLLGGAVARPAGLRLGPLAAAHWKAPTILGVIGVAVLAFFITYGVSLAVFRAILRRAGKNPTLSGVDKLLGFLFGGAKAAMILFVLLSAFIFFEKPFTQLSPYRFDTRGSQVAAFVRAHDLFTHFTFPGMRGLTAMARAGHDPDAAAALARDPELQTLTRDPRVISLLHDADLQHALQSGDSMALLRNNRVMTLLSDPAIQEHLSRIGENVPTPPRP